MSDTDSSIAIPSDNTLREALRDAVADVYRVGDMAELTVKRIRAAAENSLDLPAGFFKGDFRWKGESDRVIKEETDAQEAVATTSPAAKTKLSPSTKVQSGKTQKTTKPASPGDTSSQPRKKRKIASPVEPESDESTLSSLRSDLSENASGPHPSRKDREPLGSSKEEKGSQPASKLKGKKQTMHPASDSKSEVCTAPVPRKANGDSQHVGSESEMSEVLDEAPPPKKKHKAPSTTKKEPRSMKRKSKEDPDIDPQEAEIKRLQSWLLKCGIRKLWHRELAPYHSSKAKINHLKAMLKDAGMEGRYSIEKAKQIKDERELKAELEAVQEGAKHWGEPTAVEDDERRPTRRLAKGLKQFDFLGDDDGEETD